MHAAGNLQQAAAATGALGALLAFSPGDESGVADAIAYMPGAVHSVAGLLSGTPLPLRTTAAVMLCNLSRAPGGQQARTQPMPPAPVPPPVPACPRTATGLLDTQPCLKQHPWLLVALAAQLRGCKPCKGPIE